MQLMYLSVILNPVLVIFSGPRMFFSTYSSKVMGKFMLCIRQRPSKANAKLLKGENITDNAFKLNLLAY